MSHDLNNTVGLMLPPVVFADPYIWSHVFLFCFDFELWTHVPWDILFVEFFEAWPKMHSLKGNWVCFCLFLGAPPIWVHSIWVGMNLCYSSHDGKIVLGHLKGEFLCSFSNKIKGGKIPCWSLHLGTWHWAYNPLRSQLYVGEF